MNSQQLNEASPAYRTDADLSADATDPVLEALKRDIDFSLVEKNLRLTIEQRAQQLVNSTRFIAKFRPVVDSSQH